MKRAKILLVLTLTLLASFSTATYALTKSETENMRDQYYAKYYTGAKSSFGAISRDSIAYTTITNNGSSRYYLEASVYEFTYDTGFTASAENTGYTNAGLQIHTDAIIRDVDSYIKYYSHLGRCSISSNYSSILDDYFYKANQYY